MNVLVFTIKTIPDINGARRLYDLHGLSDEDVAKAIFHKRRQQANTEILRHHLHKIVAISAVLVNAENFTVWSLGDETASEQDLLQRFYAGIERYNPHLVCWNGRGFDLPVIHYRSLLYPVNAQKYWGSNELGDNYRSDDYLSSLFDRHTNLMDVFATYRSAATIELEEIATLCGFPGNTAKPGSKIWKIWLAGDIKGIRDFCETDVLNTYLVYLNWQRNLGNVNQQQYQQQCQKVRDELKNSAKDHLVEFEKSWIDL